jgi:hypothetical protein
MLGGTRKASGSRTHLDEEQKKGALGSHTRKLVYRKARGDKCDGQGNDRLGRCSNMPEGSMSKVDVGHTGVSFHCSYSFPPFLWCGV